jgi:UDP-GlcNAc3NAcA epimerase
MSIKIITVVGARPQFIKAAALSRKILQNYRNEIEEIIVHTGQHFDENMSKVFFEELDIPIPLYNLEISGGTHGSMTGRMLASIEDVLITEKPDWVLVYGDTNSTLAGALAAAKLHMPVAHVEAGLRSFNKRMPEEINRIVADSLSHSLFCPTETAVQNLLFEGVSENVFNVGDVMYDAALVFKERALEMSNILKTNKLQAEDFALVTCHRAENTDDPEKLSNILQALSAVSKSIKVVLPLHPRTKKLIAQFGLGHHLANYILLEPLSFLDMVALEQAAKIIITDSGGVQKEAFFYNVPCVTMRDETEWVETVTTGRNILAGTNTQNIINAAEKMSKIVWEQDAGLPYGDGNASEKIIAKLLAI